MKRGDVWVSIRGRQMLAEDIWEESMDMVTSGTISPEPEGFTLTYLEDDVSTGMGNTTTTLMFGGGRVTVFRSGEVSTQMVFEKDRKHVSYYETEMGTMTVGVSTSRLRCDLGGAQGPIDLEMEYTLEIDNEVAGENSISIRVSRDAGTPINASPPRNPRGFSGQILH